MTMLHYDLELQSLINEKGYSLLLNSKTTKILGRPDITHLVQHLPCYTDLKILIIGSSTTEGFRSSGAFVGSVLGCGTVPKAIDNFQGILRMLHSVRPGSFDSESWHSK